MVEFPLGQIVRQLRRVANMSQRELAAAADLPQPQVAALESREEIGQVRLGTVLRLVEAAGCALVVVGPDGEPIDPLRDGDHDRAGRRYPAHLDVRRVRNLYDWWAWQHYSTWAKPPLPEQTYDLNREVRDWRRANPDATDSPYYAINAAEREEESKRRRRARRRKPLEPIDDDYWTDDVDP